MTRTNYIEANGEADVSMFIGDDTGVVASVTHCQPL